MTLPEAERIVALDNDGKLDRGDPEVDKIVFEAHTVVQRSSLWGSGPGHPSRRRTRFVFIASALFLATWIAGLLVPLLINSGQ
jgi:hypothetical protein